MNLLTQNSKMKKSSQNGITVVNWTIPAFQSKTGLRTCPNAGLCAVGCYARQGAYIWGNVSKAHEAKLELTQTDAFVSEMISEIETWLKKRNTKHLKVRIHDAGDFYNETYLNRWLEVMAHFKTETRVSFYAYTKQVEMFKKYQNENLIPVSFRVIFSFGGRQDNLINIETDFHSRVFQSETELLAAGYQDGTDDDMVAAMGVSNKVGLVYHGTKSYNNTKWDKVA
jgi:Gene product 88